MNFIIQALKDSIPENGRILDVGCGNGIIAMNLGVLNYKITGIDISEKAILIAKRNNEAKNVTFKVTSAENIIVDDDKYDAIICSEVIEHLSEPQKLIKTISELCDDNGILIVTVPNGFGPRESFITKPVQRIKKKNSLTWKLISKIKLLLGYSGTTIQSDADDLLHIQFFSKGKLMQLADGIGFVITKFEHSNFIDDVFPFSFVSKKIRVLQKIDCFIADFLPSFMVGGFHTVWKKKYNKT